MAVRAFLAILLASALLSGGGAFAMGSEGSEGGAPATQEDGSTSGSASGTNVEPSTSIQKQYTGRSSSDGSQFKGSSNAAGNPGIEGRTGTQSGASSRDQPLNK